MIDFGPDVCGNLGLALDREWLETNGLGGFASSSIVGLNTRRYHGLLVAATLPPVGRTVLLSKFDETVIVDGQRFELSANQYPGVVHPQGFNYLKRFRLNPFPIFTYEIAVGEIEKSVFMVHGQNTTVVQYRANFPGKRVELEVRPLIAFRDFHSTTHENSALNPKVIFDNGMASIAPYTGLPRLYLAHNAIDTQRTGEWYRNFEYAVEQERGLDFREDLFQPMLLRVDLSTQPTATLIASTERHPVLEAEEMREGEIGRRRNVANAAPADRDFVRALTTAAHQYVVARKDGQTIIAGYPWFSDWGRDTMISLPGLTLVTGRYDTARQILEEFAKFISEGMLPNCFPDAGAQPEYNTVDATLWYFEAIRAYFEYSVDVEVVRNLYPVLTDIIAWHVRGTRYGIKVDSSGLLTSGAPGVQLTWMDAKVGDWVVTPRYGKPVEIQALWFNALCVMEDFAAMLGDAVAQKRYSGMATIARWSFNRLFWNVEAGCLYDVVNGGPPDASIRPNQIFAVGLRHSMLSADRARQVVDVVQRELATPYGLRTLSPRDSRYIGHYAGDQRSRDGAYHQGTVWPWLMGPFITAYLKVNGGSNSARAQAAEWLQPLRSHLSEAGLGQISEIFDGDPPHRPCGCFAQAWSVAEALRTLVEDVLCCARSRNSQVAGADVTTPKRLASHP
jgi:predicted glycogen debranching enzyme